MSFIVKLPEKSVEIIDALGTIIFTNNQEKFIHVPF